jgi:hypothetical protein
MANDATPTRTVQPTLDATSANLERARQRLTTMLAAARMAAAARTARRTARPADPSDRARR